MHRLICVFAIHAYVQYFHLARIGQPIKNTKQGSFSLLVWVCIAPEKVNCLGLYDIWVGPTFSPFLQRQTSFNTELRKKLLVRENLKFLLLEFQFVMSLKILAEHGIYCLTCSYTNGVKDTLA